MKQLLLLTILALTFYLQLFGQENVNCPTIKLNSLSEQTPIGGNMDFSVSLMGKFDNKNVEFKWTVSNGANFNGQNTSVISIPIDENLAGQNITATVEIKGLPKGCKSSFSESNKVETRRIIIQDGDQENTFRGNSSPQEYFWRIHNLAIGVQNEKGSKGVVAFKFTNSSEQRKSVATKKKLLKMAKNRKVSLDGIEVKIEKGKVYEITVEFISAESTKPS
jgi:hypothetical protein